MRVAFSSSSSRTILRTAKAAVDVRSSDETVPLTRSAAGSRIDVMEGPQATIIPSKRTSSWRGVLLLVVGALLLGLGPAGVLIGLGLFAFSLDKMAPKKLDKLIDFLTF